MVVFVVFHILLLKISNNFPPPPFQNEKQIKMEKKLESRNLFSEKIQGKLKTFFVSLTHYVAKQKTEKKKDIKKKRVRLTLLFDHEMRMKK